MIHVVDMYPTLAALAGASPGKSKPLDGLDVWETISEGKPSPRTEIVYNIEPFRGGVRKGDWKLIWRSPLPPSIELYNIAQDPYEKNNVAAANPEQVVALKKRANELASTMDKSLLLQAEFGAVRDRLHMPPALRVRKPRSTTKSDLRRLAIGTCRLIYGTLRDRDAARLE